ncbi:ankyrin repeat domain-containing protein 40-like isoform X2 [Crotalus tigris]|uniref:ankyrin repeat domain-containing protein 40-like isoform X2 n=1 Tax=Crotalus tigris TaxID=88082 RepID=UPI00192F854F|nr:ankyrin repeat domain-containing protein 40-like isoform X2 [Crotalus tigris]
MSSYLEERLREAAALGNLEEVRILVRNGVAVNAQNEVNGWTCLHWACKRNQTHIVKYLLDHGANKGIFTKNRDLAAHLTSKKEIRKLLGAPEVEGGDNQEVNNLKLLSGIANCLTNESFPAIYHQKGDGAALMGAPPRENNSATPHLSAGETSLCLSTVQAENNDVVISLHKETELSGKHLWVEELISSVVAEASEDIKSSVQSSIPSFFSSAHHNRDHLTSCPSRQHMTNQTNDATMDAESALQPLLFSRTFPCNMDELVLKVRVQNPKEYDFIEIELDRKQLNYQDLLKVCCCELGINSEQVEKIRKLPNTLLRKDEDVARLQNFQELELVLARSITSSLRNAAVTTLVEKTCYNIKAANLIY